MVRERASRTPGGVDEEWRMSSFAERLFAGSPFVRWSIGIVVLLTGLAFVPLLLEAHGRELWIGLALEAVLVLLGLPMLAPRRFAWAGRALCGLVFLAYVAYVIDMWIEKPDSFAPGSRPGASTGFNALLGLAIIGTPALFYALRRPRHVAPVADSAEEPATADETIS